MRHVKISRSKSPYIGELPRGCRQCIRGEKLVLFVTGVCNRNCYYCPLSPKRKNTDKTWANEVLVKTDEDVIKEAKLCSAKGAGITGGDPLQRMDKTLHYITLLKKEFGPEFHIHLYNSSDSVGEKELQELEKAGLDEIRFHLNGNWSVVKLALNHKFDVGVEVPCIPFQEERLKKMVLYLEESGAKFLNLNELEFSELNFEEMRKRGFEPFGFNSAKGSEELAKRILEFALKNTKRLSVHYCGTEVKNVYQYQNRLKRRAQNIKKSFETISGKCLLKKGAVFGKNLDGVRRELIKRLSANENDFFIRADKKRIECSVENAKEAARLGYEAAVILELPTYDGFDIEVTPLSNLKFRVK